MWLSPPALVADPLHLRSGNQSNLGAVVVAIREFPSAEDGGRGSSAWMLPFFSTHFELM